ncbi:OmpA family protein [Vibrio sp. HA2012]|uniref:OmpA family protein n=1 Tax=Vibrio sp. HA2012 TaxID=1971595 RepID=UPI000C2CD110|nr:OmpA family protein [Vibrio sp. HA2012]PJC86102.1 OmpA family protein [Vibrio sp. HA2012]
MKARNLLYGIMVLVASTAGLSVSAAESNDDINRALHYYCAKKDVAFEESIVIGGATQVNLNSGPFYLISSPSAYQATIELVVQEMIRAGISSECAEYLLSKGQMQGYKQGDILARVFFDFDRAHLTADARYILQSLTEKLQRQAVNLILEGHTDSIGTENYNMALGLRRSESVKTYLINKGIDPQTLTTMSKGESQPVADNKTKEGRRQNRRVEMISSK